MNIKHQLKNLFLLLHWDVTKNLEYDRLTRQVLQRVLQPGSTCIDVGCHKGEVLDMMLNFAPDGQYFAFEPIPYLYESLLRQYKNKVQIFPYALADQTGQSTFQLVKNAPAYSGIRKRKYAVRRPDIKEITVELKTLDEVIPKHIHVDFIKIDVEGGEFGVLKGSRRILEKDKPVVVFECGLGASDYYGTNPLELYYYVLGTGLQIYTLSAFLKNQQPLTADAFIQLYETNKEYYFLAYNPVS